MNYWPSEVTNLSELNEPLFRLIKEVSNTGKETAKIMYGANGWVLHHNTDIWRITGAVDKAPSGMWPSGGAWLCRHLWERYLYTGDVEFLRSVYRNIFLDRNYFRGHQVGIFILAQKFSGIEIERRASPTITVVGALFAKFDKTFFVPEA